MRTVNSSGLALVWVFCESGVSVLPSPASFDTENVPRELGLSERGEGE